MEKKNCEVGKDYEWGSHKDSLPPGSTWTQEQQLLWNNIGPLYVCDSCGPSSVCKATTSNIKSGHGLYPEESMTEYLSRQLNQVNSMNPCMWVESITIETPDRQVLEKKKKKYWRSGREAIRYPLREVSWSQNNKVIHYIDLWLCWASVTGCHWVRSDVSLMQCNEKNEYKVLYG